MERSKISKVFLIGISFWIFSVVCALWFGAVDYPDLDLILQIRVPRIVLAAAIGMGLSISGAVLQALFANPLCEPYTLGISSGSALGAVIGISLGLEWAVAGLAGSAFMGALLFIVILYFLSQRFNSGSAALLLAGVMLGFLGSSLLAVVISLEPNGLQNSLIWMFGDLSRARIKGAVSTFVAILFISIWIWRYWRELDALLLGEENALSLGVDVQLVRSRLVVLTSLVIALCVSAGGIIGFVGLIIPHFARRFVGSMHIRLLPLAAIWGAAVLTFADCLSRTLVRPFELPVGVVTALLGSPVFLWIMVKKNRMSTIQ